MAAGSFWKWLLASAPAERHRWPLWLPVMLGAGAALHFALPAEPPFWLGWGATALAAILAAAAAIGPRGKMALALLTALVLGFAIAKLKEEQVAAPLLGRPITQHLTGRVRAVDPAPRGGGSRP
jgi:competence protein ComEC